MPSLRPVTVGEGERRSGGRRRRRPSPILAALVGAACISSSGIVVDLAHAEAGTTAFLRCAFALPLLYPLAVAEERKLGTARALRARLMAALAGAFLGADLVLWTHSLYDVGAGIATVLGNLQVLFVTAIAWAVLKERPKKRFLFVLPFVLLGVVLCAGLVGRAATGNDPAGGIVFGVATSVCYAIFILLLRRATSGQQAVAGPLADASTGAALAGLLLGLLVHELSLRISLGALGWLVLLAVVSQTLGWLCITSALPRLPAALSSLLLLLQPAGALVLAAVVLSQRPSVVQLLGAAVVCGGVLCASWPGEGDEPQPAPAPG